MVSDRARTSAGAGNVGACAAGAILRDCGRDDGKMNSKEMAQRFAAASDKGKEAKELVCELVIETGEIAKLRHAKSNPAMLSILREQDQKWKAFARKASTPEQEIIQDGFRKAICQFMPSVYEAWEYMEAHHVS